MPFFGYNRRMLFNFFSKKKPTELTTRPLPGTLELLPQDQIAFNKMKDIIESVYQSYGFIPMDTPVFERAEILGAKVGEDTKNEMYVFKKGDTDLGLRFDLTVPLARYVAENHRELTFPFRRYQIAKSYRGERPQRGRYREFYQCDIDVIGEETLDFKNDALILSVGYSIFKKLHIGPFVIRVSNRNILKGFLESMSLEEKSADIMRAIDKKPKVPEEKFIEMLRQSLISDEQISKITAFVNIKGTNTDIIAMLTNQKITNDTYVRGVEEISSVIKAVDELQVPNDHVTIDLAIVRGLDYYTATVYETFLVESPELGSLCSGGRYENLMQGYVDKKMPGVGAGIGLTRLFVPFKEKGLITEGPKTTTDVLIVPLVDSLVIPAHVANFLRMRKIHTEIYLENVPMKKKLAYANRQNIPFVILIGEDEIKSEKYTLKNMETGEQKQVILENLPTEITL